MLKSIESLSPLLAGYYFAYLVWMKPTGYDLGFSLFFCLFNLFFYLLQSNKK